MEAPFGEGGGAQRAGVGGAAQMVGARAARRWRRGAGVSWAVNAAGRGRRGAWRERGGRDRRAGVVL